MRGTKLLYAGMLLILSGIALVVAGSAGGNALVGGFVLIGPFPIVFGEGSNGGDLAVLSVALGLVFLASLMVFSLIASRRLGGNA